MACREEDIPEVGDTDVYDIADISILVVRVAADDDQGVLQRLPAPGPPAARRRRASDASCAARSTASAGTSTARSSRSRRVGLPAGRRRTSSRLPEVKVGTWGGFVFVNLDPDCRAARGLPRRPADHFDAVAARGPLHRRCTSPRCCACNWKVAQEAFMEAFHVVTTHPQLLAGFGDANSQYDVFGNFSRAITPNGTPEPAPSWDPTEQEMFNAMTDRRLDEPPARGAGGVTARETAASRPRRRSVADRRGHGRGSERRRAGRQLLLHVFPNFHPWGVQPHRVSVPPERRSARRVDHGVHVPLALCGRASSRRRIHWLGPDDDWTNAPELGFLARVFNQDTFNLSKVQLG